MLDCNICGQNPAAYRIIDHSTKDTVVSYCCPECMFWWQKAIRQAEQRGRFLFQVEPIKNYGYTCDKCGRIASDVMIQTIGQLSITTLCSHCTLVKRGLFWLFRELPISEVPLIVPIEEFLQEGIRWPGK